MSLLSQPIQYLKGVGPYWAKKLAKKGVLTLEDALYFLPRAVEDRSSITPIAQLFHQKKAVVEGKVLKKRLYSQGRSHRLVVTLYDGTGYLKLVWFRLFPGLEKQLSLGVWLRAFGQVRFFQGALEMTHPDFEVLGFDKKKASLSSSETFGKVLPIYSEMEGVSQKVLRRIIQKAVRKVLPEVKEYVPSYWLESFGLEKLPQSFYNLHFPTKAYSNIVETPEYRRIVFEEFLIMQLALELKKRTIKAKRSFVLPTSLKVEEFIKRLPFKLTEDQKKAIETISSELSSPSPMCRLVQGDVGSGKTVVALAAAIQALAAETQVAFMVPTEVLAEQHYKKAKVFIKDFPVLLLTHSTVNSERLKQLACSSCGLVIGTHALFQKGVCFHRLSLVIIDEQHRFGVGQRQALFQKAKGYVPHVLLLTATPIPRTLALTAYGDLDYTLIRQKPYHKKPIKTRLLLEKDRPFVYRKIREIVARGEQAYLIYPLIDPSEKLSLKAASLMYEQLQKEPLLEGCRLALLHGRMKGEEKERVIEAFREHRLDVLVSTTVVEVGIDVPNATLMVIEHPERLGLSQLHQLRGRVGRGEKPGLCFLVARSMYQPRLRILSQTEDGFEIAEQDLKLRGPGEFLGSRQSGLGGFKVANIVRDASLLDGAKRLAREMVRDRSFSHTFPSFRKMVKLYESKMSWLYHG